MNPRDHIMLDLETTGVSAGCCVLSIGATTLDLSAGFYKRISLESCTAAGLITLPSTMAWWDKQSKEAREEAFSGTDVLFYVLVDFASWFRLIGSTAKIWGNGADFDPFPQTLTFFFCNPLSQREKLLRTS